MFAAVLSRVWSSVTDFAVIESHPATNASSLAGSSASAEAVAQLMRETDAVAEVHNTLRRGVPVELID